MSDRNIYEQQARRHLEATRAPRPGFERAILSIWRGLQEYARAHRAAYDSPLGDDAVMGEEYALDMLRALNGLLDGECGRLDKGTIHSEIRALCRDHGLIFDPGAGE